MEHHAEFAGEWGVIAWNLFGGMLCGSAIVIAGMLTGSYLARKNRTYPPSSYFQCEVCGHEQRAIR